MNATGFMNNNLPNKRKQRFYLVIKLLVLILLVLLLIRFCTKDKPVVQSDQEQKPVVVTEVVNVQDEWSPDLQEEQQVIEEAQVPQMERQEEFSIPVQTDQQEDSPVDLVQEKEELIHSKDERSFDSQEEIKVLSEGKVEAAIQSEQPKISTNDSVTKEDLVEAKNIVQRKELPSKVNRYHPYFAMGGVKFFNHPERAATTYDIFLPLFQDLNWLIFTDLRIFNRTEKPFEGNVHLGYRYLFPETKQIIGVYGSFDRKKTAYGNYFSQVTIGGEYWRNRLFLGGNLYFPIGTKKRSIGVAEEFYYKGHRFLCQGYEEAIRGVDAEIGISITENLIGYLGGYYFRGWDVKDMHGVSARVDYRLYPHVGKRWLRVFDGAELRAGVKKDTSRGLGLLGFVELKLKIGLSSHSNHELSPFVRHMVDLPRRDPDIVTADYNVVKVEEIRRRQALQLADGSVEVLDEELDDSWWPAWWPAWLNARNVLIGTGVVVATVVVGGVVYYYGYPLYTSWKDSLGNAPPVEEIELKEFPPRTFVSGKENVESQQEFSVKPNDTVVPKSNGQQQVPLKKPSKFKRVRDVFERQSQKNKNLGYDVRNSQRWFRGQTKFFSFNSLSKLTGSIIGKIASNFFQGTDKENK